MTQIQTLALVILLMAMIVSATLPIGSYHSEPSSDYEWKTEPKYLKTISKPSILELKKESKWSWVPSWPWKKEKETTDVHQDITHYPVWKIHKYKGIEIRPVKVVGSSYPPSQVKIHPPTGYNIPEIKPPLQNFVATEPKTPITQYPPSTYSQVLSSEKYAPVYPVYQQEVPYKEHTELVQEIPENHKSEEQSAQNWAIPVESSQWIQSLTPEQQIHEVSEDEKAFVASFIGEGHSIATIEKWLPTLRKDKKLLDKLKYLYTLKSSLIPKIKTKAYEKKSKTLSWLPSLFKGHIDEFPQEIESHQPQVQEEHGINEYVSVNPPLYHVQAPITQGYESYPQINTVFSMLPEVQDVYVPGLQNVPLPEVPEIQGVIPQAIGSGISTEQEKIAQPGYQAYQYIYPQQHNQWEAQYQAYQNQQQESQGEAQYQTNQSPQQQYKEQYPPYPEMSQLQNSYGQPLSSDSYASPSEQTEISVQAPSLKSNAQAPEAVTLENASETSVHLPSINATSTQPAV